MKVKSLMLVIIAISFAITSVSGDNFLATTKYIVYKIAGTNQPPPGSYNNPEWYKLNCPVLRSEDFELPSALLDGLQGENCESDVKICLVQVKVIDGTAMEIRGVRTGFLI